MGDVTFEVVNVAGGQLAYRESGAGEPLLMHHGGESNKGQYTVFAPLLADGIRAISYDQRDVGDSFSAAAPYSIGDLADDCVQLMDALRIDKAHILGFSFGGVVALHVGIRHPDRVRTLIVGAAPADVSTTTEYAKDIIARPPDERAELMLQALFSPKGQADADLVAAARQGMVGGVAASDSYRIGALRSHDADVDFAAITAPTLLIYGSDDPLVAPATGRFLADRIPAAKLEIIEHGRHGLSSEFREPVAKLVSEFVVRHPTVRETFKESNNGS